MPRLFVLDALGLAYRAYYAFIRRPLINARGENTSAIFGFANSALKIRREERPDHWALAWDGPGPTHRHLRYPEYKAHRKPMPDDLFAQLPALKDLAAALGLAVIEVPGVEADDVMATLARRGERDGFDVALVTSDKDMLQLVNERVRVLSPTGREEYEWVDRARVREKWGVAPEQMTDLMALIGDASDNVPGVPGVGPKTAAELISQFETLDGLYERLAEVKRPALRERLAVNREQAFLSRELVTVLTDCDVPLAWDDLRCGPIRREALTSLARRYELQRLERIAESLGVGDEQAGPPIAGRPSERRGSAAEMPERGFGLVAADPASAFAKPAAVDPPPPGLFAPPAEAPCAPWPAAGPAAQETSVTPSSRPPSPQRLQGSLDLWTGEGGAAGRLASFTEALHAVRARAIHGLAIVPVSTRSDARRARLVGLALATRDGTTCYVPLAHETGPNFTFQQVRDWLAPTLDDPSVPKVAENLKRTAHALANAGFALDGLGFDVHLGSFLCDPDRPHGLGALAADFLGVSLPPIPAARDVASAPQETVAHAAERAAAALFPLADAMTAQLEARDQWSLWERVEQPLIAVLWTMERAGVLVDRALLQRLATEAGAELARMEEAIHALAGEPFNLQSGPQVSRVLFEKLGLEAGRKTKTGFSTDQGVLEQLAASHPLPGKLLEYRALAKLKSTYLDTLPLAVDPHDGRVHTTYHQSGAATGRLSSSDPNLQNIPMRSPQGREIRRAFIAPSGRLLIGADYSQIELRLMAHLAGDPALIEAFLSGEDVHASTARRIFGISEGALDPTLRARAKVVNFGVMYGMGARSLSQQMAISLEDARAFIAGYFRVYAGVRDFLDRNLDEARRRGFVETLFGRRRYLPALAGDRGGERAAAERIATNAPIQGSAADLMKLAMIRVHAALKRSCPSARLLLQVHDELLLECPADEAVAVSAMVRAEMEGCVTLRVPLEVSVGQGPSWFDVH